MQVIYHMCSKNNIEMKQIYPAFSSQITQNGIKTTLSVPLSK